MNTKQNQSKQSKNLFIYQKKYHRIFNPYQYYHLFQKIIDHKQKYIEQLQQLGITDHQLKSMPIHQIVSKTHQPISQSYSMKYMGMNQGQIGVLSKRIPIFKQVQQQHSQLKQNPKKIVNGNYLVNSFFYPKPLRTKHIRKQISSLNTRNLETEIKKEFDKNQKIRADKILMRFQKRKIKGSWKNIRANSRQRQKCLNRMTEQFIQLQKEEKLKKTGKSYSRILQKMDEQQSQQKTIKVNFMKSNL